MSGDRDRVFDQAPIGRNSDPPDLASSEGPTIGDNLTSQPMWIVIASSESTASDHLAELVRLQAERARASGHKPGEMVEGVEAIVIRRNSETGRKHYGLLKWGLIPNHAPNMSRPHLHARAETVAELRPFAQSFRRRRCVITVDFFKQRRLPPPRPAARSHVGEPAAPVEWAQPDRCRHHPWTTASDGARRPGFSGRPAGRRRSRTTCFPIWRPLSWQHINLTGDYDLDESRHGSTATGSGPIRLACELIAAWLFLVCSLGAACFARPVLCRHPHSLRTARPRPAGPPIRPVP